MSERDPHTYAIIVAAMEVHKELGCGFIEPVYQEALAIELADRVIDHQTQVEIPIWYKGKCLQAKYRADFLCFDSVIAELKALSVLSGTEEAQVINYLKASGHETGLLLNFGGQSLEFKRFALSRNRPSSQSA